VRRPPAHGTNRRHLCAGLGAAMLAAPYKLQAQSADPAFFRGYRSQFIQMEPRTDVSGLKLQRLDGGERGLSTYRGKALLISFWASWCPPCRRELPVLARLQAGSAQERFAILPVSVDHDPTKARTFVQNLHLTKFDSFMDPNSLIASGPNSASQAPFRLYGMPISYIVASDGRVAGYLTGEADWGSDAALALLRSYI
jgi:thiol-disulfide isomerase/thioredoxin